MKNLRIFAALFLAFGSLVFVQPAHSDAYADAQAALAAGQQEVIDAQAALVSASAAAQAASESLAVAQAAYNDPSNSYTVASTVQTTTQNVVQNGTFDNASAWSGIAMYESWMYNNYYAAVVRDGVLVGSYSSGNFYLQTGTFASPTRTVSFAVDVWNNANQRNDAAYDYYRIEFRTYAANGTRLNYFNFQYGGAFHDWITRGATYYLSQEAVSWDIGFRLADGGYWNGNYGPAIDNVRLFATMTTGTPEHTVIDPVVVQSLQTATQVYDQAVINLAAAQLRYDNAVSAIASLEAAVSASAPTESPEASSQSPTATESPSVSTEASESGTISPTPETTSSPEPQTESPSVSEEVTQSPSIAPSVSPAPSTSSPPTWDFIINEGGVLQASAPTNMLFSGVIARYVAHDTDCGLDVSQIVGAVFIGTNMASINADNGVFGDPCPGWYKKLTVAFTYASDPSSVPTQSPTVSPEPTPTPSPEPTPTPQPEPQPTSTPTPEPSPEPTPEPQPTPSETPRPTPSPEPEPTPEPVDPTPTPSPEPEPSPTTTPEPTPTEQPEPEPSETTQPSPTPDPVPEEPESGPTVDPTPEPSPEPKPEPEAKTPEDVTSDTPIEDVVAVLENVEPTSLTEEQAAVLVSIALETFETAEPGSEAYEQALDLLLVAAQQDDIVLDEELAAIPLIGNVAGAAVEVLNALGNAGADMSPKVREQSEKVVIAAVIVGQVAMTATAAATSAAAAAARRP